MNKRYKNLILWEISKIKWLPVIALVVMYFTSIAFKEKAMLEDCRVLTEGYMNSYWVIDLVCTGFNAFNIGWVLLLAFCQFNDESNIWYSLPYRQKELHTAKIITGIGFITLMLAIYTVWIIALYHKYIPFMEDIYNLYPGLNGNVFNEATIIQNMLITWIVLLFIYSIFLLCQYMVNQPVVAAIFGIVILVTPIFLIEIAIRYLHLSIDETTRFLYFPFFPFEGTGLVTDNYMISASLQSVTTSSTSIEWQVSQGRLFSIIKAAYYALLSLITLFIASKCANSELRAENNGLLPGKIYGKVFIIVVTLFVAGSFGNSFMYSVNKYVGIFVFVFFGIVTFVITWAILKKQGVVLWQRK